ncbi:uncharacterized protein LOC135161363 [Diachasmimorpha longicaudata]|uniref:uncharacterized protein LOC135161363 n=1 Tax=Diachasmimorpha longicaudata TaxID=58733 RepID=UPI0030B8701C
MEVEKCLDKDYFGFISQSHEYYSKLSADETRKLCEKWLVKILGQKVNGIREKRNRNIFMMHLLTQMHAGQLTGIFSSPPANGDLPSSNWVFDGVEEEDIATPKTDPVIADDIKEFSDERSADARVFSAFRHLPDNQGLYGFISLTLDPKEDDNYEINACTVDEAELGHARAMRKLHKGNIFTCSEPSERQMEDFYLNNVEKQISGDVSQMFEDLSASSESQCWKFQDHSFLKDSLKQIDREIRGEVKGDHKLVRFLVSRLGEDLKRDPKMRHLIDLPPQQRQLRILEILRQKLVLRKQEKKQKKLLTKMEERMMRNWRCSCGEDDQSNLMWTMAVTRPLKETTMRRLRENYPSEIIPVFLELLSNDRQGILENGLERQQDLVESMRAEVYRDIQTQKAAYNKARESYREWNEILANVEEMMFEAGPGEGENIEDSTPEGSENLLKDMIAQMKETERLINDEADKADEMTSKIYDINSWKFSTEGDKSKDWSWEVKQEVEKLKISVSEYESIIQGQTQRIEHLKSGLSLK